jgi:hypothetical protein
MMRVSSNKVISTRAAFRFLSMNLAMDLDILLISSNMWRPQNGALFFE